MAAQMPAVHHVSRSHAAGGYIGRPHQHEKEPHMARHMDSGSASIAHSASTPVLEVRDVTKTYGGHSATTHALNGICLLYTSPSPRDS